MMSTPIKLAAFIAGLVLLFGAGFGLGRVVGNPTEPVSGHDDSHDAMEEMNEGPTTPGGLQISEDGYTLGEVSAPPVANQAGTLSFRILDQHGKVVTRFNEQHEKLLHLIVVRSDTAEFRHVHPTMDANGMWSIDWTWPTGGSYRVFADFDATESPTQLTLGRTVDVAGTFDPTSLPPTSRTTQVDGYSVALTGDLTTSGGPLTFTVTRNGAQIRDLEPYLGAYGHLVALRAGDLAYLHVHPEASDTAGPEIAFHAQAPSAGTYRLFLDFQLGGVVRTAEFTIDAAQVHQ